MESIQLFNYSNRFNNSNDSNSNNNNSSSRKSSSHHYNSNGNEDPSSKDNTESFRWGGSSHNFLFTLSDSMASFAASPPPQLHNISNTYDQHIDENYQNNTDHANNIQNMPNKNINAIMSSSNHLNNKPNHLKVSRRPSVFTTLSGSRYYMDETKGEPIPVPASIVQPSSSVVSYRVDPNTKAVRRQSSQLTLISNVSIPEDDPVLIPYTHRQHPNHNQNPYPRPSMSHQHYPLDGSSSHRGSYGGQLPTELQPQTQTPMQQPFRNSMTHPQQNPSVPQDRRHSEHNIHEITQQQRRQQQQQQLRSSTTGTPTSTPLKSVVMIDRIPPPAPPLPPFIRGIELNCKMDILSAPISRGYFVQHQQQLTGPMDRNNTSCHFTSAFAVGTPMVSFKSSSNKGSSSLRIPYHSYTIECSQCSDAMVVSKYCIVVQCPQCRTISTCEATPCTIAIPQYV